MFNQVAVVFSPCLRTDVPIRNCKDFMKTAFVFYEEVLMMQSLLFDMTAEVFTALKAQNP